MKRLFAGGLAAVLFVISAAGIYLTFYGTYDVVLPQNELQQKIDAKLPHVTKNGVTVSKVQLDLSNDKIGFDVDASITKLGAEYALSSQTKGTLVYDNTKGEFFFLPDKLKLNDVKIGGTSVVGKVGQLLGKLKDPNKASPAQQEVRAAAEGMVQNFIQEASHKVMLSIPVYKLPDNFKGNVTNMLLKSVEVKNGNIIAHLSLAKYSKMVIVYIVMLIAAAVITTALILRPNLGR
ncbi:MAG: DUF1439 domain-containing protein [Candidatus Obscuribacterales bacterium]|nr:DUF1439 domain-containing protein [Candidatus Obscuribacterales bacterium]